MIEWNNLKLGDEVYWGSITFSYGFSITSIYPPELYKIIKVDSSSVTIKKIKPWKSNKKHEVMRLRKYNYGNGLLMKLYSTREEIIDDWNSTIYNEIDRATNVLERKLSYCD